MSVRQGVLGAWLIASACYKPSYRDCAIGCDDVTGCPSGLSCESATHMCTSGASCTDVGDGSGSGSGSGSDCWSMPTSNFDPCSARFPPATKAFDTSVSAPIIATDDPTCAYMTPDGGTACLLHFTSITIASGHQFGAAGHLPLILVSDGPVQIDAQMTIGAGSQGHAGCNAGQGATGSTLGGGGAGGGFGSNGGNGGANDQNVVRPGGMTNGSASLVPLVGGCQGGNGGMQGSAVTAGGDGGGALEISSNVSITLGASALVLAPGGGGAGGAAAAGTANGGGGGGAGGAILLEAPDLALAGAVCAPGGGGGQGGVGTTGGTSGSTSMTCAGGAAASVNQGPGGVGGSTPTALPGNGGPANASGGFAGGGGGGAYGRIHFHTLQAPSGTAIVKPPAN